MQAALGAGFSSLLLTVHGSNVDTSGLPNAVHLLASGCVEMVRQTGFKRAAAGYARVVEVAECGGGLWYPHLHLLAVFPEGEAGPRGYLEGAIGKFFPSASGFSMGEEMVLNLPRFVNYATKIPQGITPERWVELREATQQKGGYLSYGGVLRLTKRGLPPRVRAGVASAKG